MGKPAPEAVAISQQYYDQLPVGYAGRYSVIADETTLTALLKAIRAGLNDSSACQAAGLDTRTLQRWKARAKAEPESAYAAFDVVLTRVREERKQALLERMERHGANDWRADAWLLERTDQAQFGLQHDKSPAGITVIVGGDAKMLFAQPAGETLSVSVEAERLSPPVADDMHRLSGEK